MNTKRLVNLTVFWNITSMLLITALGTDQCIPLSVIQSPAEITVTAGANIKLFCAWNYDCKAERVTIEWSKDGERLQPFQTVDGQVRNGTTAFNFTNIKANDTGVYICKIKVVIPVLEGCDGNGTILTVDGSVAKTTLIPQSVLIGAVCGGTLIIFLVSLCVCQWKSVRHRRLAQHTYANTSEGYVDKRKRPHSQTEEEENKDIKDAEQKKNKVNMTESETGSDDLRKLFQVSREDIAEARKKLKVKRAYFFKGDENPNRSGNGNFKRKRSFHLYINSRELKKQSQTQHVVPTQAKQHCTRQKKCRQARGKQLTAEELYENI